MRPSELAALALFGSMSAACSDYGFANEKYESRSDETGGVADPSGGDDGGGDDGGSGGADDTGDPDEPDDPGDPDDPDEFIEDCADGSVATFPSGPIYVLSWDPTSASGTLVASTAGWYHVYDYTIAESESSQTNETAYFRITNATNTGGAPYHVNCGDEWVIKDADNSGALPSGTRIYIGTFYLEAGQNEVTMYHYCPLQRAGECDDLHITSDSSSTCETGNVNSVHFDGEGICIVPAT